MKIRLLGAAVAAVFTLIGSAAHADDLADIRKKGEIVIGTLGTDEPNSFIDPKTRQIIGYEVDLGTEIAKAIGVKPVFKQISVAARIPELQQGHVDLLAASLTHNKEREALVDFSYSIIVTGQKALVKKNAGFASLHDLDGKKVLTVKGGTQEPNIRKALPNAQVVTFETSQQALLALQQGKGQAFVDDESALVNDFGKLGAAAGGYAILPENLSTEALAIAFRKGNPQLKQLVDSTLAGLERSGAAESYPELARRLVLSDQQVVSGNVVLAQLPHVSRALACQIREVHRHPQIVRGFLVERLPHLVRDVHIARLLLVLLHPATGVFHAGDAPLPGHVVGEGKQGDLPIRSNLGRPGVSVLSDGARRNVLYRGFVKGAQQLADHLRILFLGLRRLRRNHVPLEPAQQIADGPSGWRHGLSLQLRPLLPSLIQVRAQRDLLAPPLSIPPVVVVADPDLS
ncbi:Membrane-bound lytic murein transglycosylase F [Pseudomonas aeruginosa]|nr:Membrane-bound lytic murein transglycosylase F [Pseudomonas aeruginosa]